MALLPVGIFDLPIVMALLPSALAPLPIAMASVPDAFAAFVVKPLCDYNELLPDPFTKPGFNKSPSLVLISP